ncbi:MAG: hypothetical protein QF894_10950, partial [Alphaproteobacteria bacterium]|nr:hypothetical protein [Alphaproteobacteria bacterium]
MGALAGAGAAPALFYLSYVQNLLQIALTMLPSGFPGMVGAETSTIAAPAVPSRRQAAFFICSR